MAQVNPPCVVCEQKLIWAIPCSAIVAGQSSEERNDERAGKPAAETASADQGGRKRITGPVFESGRDPSQRRRIYSQLYLPVSQRAAGEAGFQRDSKSGARKAAAAGAEGKCGAIRVAVWNVAGRIRTGSGHEFRI